MHYRRFLTPGFRDLLLPSGPLHFVTGDFQEWVRKDPNALDLHLRENDCLTYYHGTTKLLDVTYRPAGDQIALSAAPAYAQAAGYPELMRTWPRPEWERLPEARHAAADIVN